MQERAFETIHTLNEMVASLDYQPTAYSRSYRVVILRKFLATDQGQLRLFEEYRDFFFMTNDRAMTASQVVLSANGRCNQESLIVQLKSGSER